MAPKSLAEQIAELDDVTPRDYDPEDIERGGNTSDEEGDGPVKDADAGREHYQAVGKAKLRNEDPVSLGKQYAGSRVSRDALMEESDDDPFRARPSDEEGSEEDDDEVETEDEDVSESEDERPTKSKGASNKNRVEEVDDMDTDGSDDDEEDIDGFDEDESDEDDLDDEEVSEEESESDEEPAKPTLKSKSKTTSKPKSSTSTDDRSELRALMATDQKSIAATLSAASKADATKGKAVKQQRATFDALLNARIKLQKGLTASNQLATAQMDKGEVDSEALKSAESAALTLWSTLEELRLTLVDAQSTDEGKKRKRPAPATPSTSTSTLWDRMASLESPSLTHRRAILDKWSLKVRNSGASTLANSRGKLLGSNAQQQTITAVLDAHVASETADLRAAKKLRTSESTSSPEEEALIYDDTAMYQSLLRDLVSQRMSSSDAITNGLDTLHLLPSRTHHVTGMRKDKVKRDVDTRASKGRKMRFDVHEKLQNFMAPEDRGTWTGRAREEFFASLLGRSAAGLLGEDSGDEEDIRDGEGSESEDEVEGGLRLFRG